MTERKIQQVNVGEIYKQFKHDLTLCVKYHRKNRPEMVKEYFGTDSREEIQTQIDVVCKPFSRVQKMQLERLIADLHNFYIQPEET